MERAYIILVTFIAGWDLCIGKEVPFLNYMDTNRGYALDRLYLDPYHDGTERNYLYSVIGSILLLTYLMLSS